MPGVELSRRDLIRRSVCTLAGLLFIPQGRDVRAGPEPDRDSGMEPQTREILVDAEPLPDRIRPHCPAWHCHLFRQIFLPLRSAGTPPFSLAFAWWIRDWRYVPVGNGVELWLEPDAPLSVYELAKDLETWNAGVRGVRIRVHSGRRLTVESRLHPIWSVFPVFLPHRSRAVTFAWAAPPTAHPERRSRPLVLSSQHRQVMLWPAQGEANEGFGSPGRISVGATLWAARKLLPQQPETKLLVDRVPRVACILINPQAVPDRDDRRAIAQLFQPRRADVLPSPLYTPAQSLFATAAVERAGPPRPQQRPQRPKEIPKQLVVDLPGHDRLLAEVLSAFTGAADGAGGLRFRTLPIEQWAENVCSGNYTVAYWEFDWRFGEATVLDAFRIERSRRAETAFVPIHDPTIQVLLQLVQQARSPREWRAATAELSGSLQREGYVVPLWYVHEFARVPLNLAAGNRYVGSLFSVT